jgi:hypothetical protein
LQVRTTTEHVDVLQHALTSSELDLDDPAIQHLVTSSEEQQIATIQPRQVGKRPDSVAKCQIEFSEHKTCFVMLIQLVSQSNKHVLI